MSLNSIVVDSPNRNSVPDVDGLLERFHAEWKQRAACRGVSDVDFFSTSETEIKRAKAICARCPVQAECAAQAERHHEEYGVWSGHSRSRRNQTFRERVAGRVADEPYKLTRDELARLVVGKPFHIRRAVIDMDYTGELSTRRVQRSLKAGPRTPCGSYQTVTVYGPPVAS